MTSGMQTVITNPNWWKRRSTLERCLTLLCAFALVTIIGLIIGLVSVILSNQMNKDSTNPPEALQVPDKPSGAKPEGSPSKVDDTCVLPECIHTASNILSSMDPTVEPCDDFYQFACGNFIRTKTIPEDKVSVSSFSDINDKLQEQLKLLIEEERDESAPNHFQLPNKLYKACMNKSLIEDLGSSPIANIAESLGGWPVIKGDSWNSDDSWTWQDTVQKFRNLGFSMDYILDFSIGVDLKNSTKRMIDIDQSAIGLSREYLVKGLNDTLVLAYYDYMVDIAVIFGANRDVALKELGESLQFEMDLANISWPNEKRRNSSALYNLRTVAQLQESYPYISWKEYINVLLPAQLSIDDDEPINVSVPSFFEALGPLLAKTPKRIIANYMMWRIHAFSISFLSEEFRKRQLEYATALSGRQEQEARWKECVDITSGSLAISIGSLYVRKHFKEDAKHIAMEMVDSIRSVFSGILTQVDWMDEQTRKSALEKLNSMTTHIGYPDEITDDSKLSEYYDSLEIDSDKYFESFLRMNVFGTDKSFNKLRLPVNKTDWIRHARPAIVNAFYSSLENSIQFPAGILQGQFFHAQRPKYMNYGAIGYVIGHEITHGFDDQGRQFDVNGNLVDWWQENTKEAYLSKARCIIEQYGNYTDKSTGLSLNGINTQGENIADNGGIKESYLAYRKWAQKNGPEPKLPGLDFRPEQMFWVSAAQTWCSIQRKESLKMRITTGVHSPSEFRVLGPISNMQDFAKDFQCPEGSPMNPVKKCEVW
ncbi:neprilysin-2 isoform X2 [Episyrphus balteatus]|uniref:neprilysin-2 isoform X2 n=1 Tax=Episyrphus balteatus TaxID=286459 RepID=UPI002485222C|nr:neprilysin-2 isoform X2 [Episyrphus balteatus]